MTTDKITVITRKVVVNTYSSSMIVMNTLKAYLGAGCFSIRYFPIFTCIFLLFAQSTYAQNRYSMVRIPANEVKHMQDLFDLGVDDDHGIRKINGFYECIISDHAMKQLRSGNITVETIVADMESFYEARLKTDYARFMKETTELIPGNVEMQSSSGSVVGRRRNGRN